MQQQPIRNKTIVIVGKPGSGKSLIASYFLSHYKRQYANWSIYYPKQDKPRNGIVKSIKEIDRIRFSPTKGVIGMDESGVNLNSRRSSSDDNIEGGKIPMLGRKKNTDIIAIGQLLYSIDKYYRDLADLVIAMRSYYAIGGKLMFEATIYRWWTECKQRDIINVWEFDLLLWTKITGISYDTLERAIFEKKKWNDRKYEKIKKSILKDAERD